jgi:hypothetical protein
MIFEMKESEIAFRLQDMRGGSLYAMPIIDALSR